MTDRLWNKTTAVVLLWLCALSVAWPATVAAQSEQAQPASKQKAQTYPPQDWAFPVETMKTFRPSAEEVLKAPEGLEGDFDVAKNPPAIDFGILPGQWPEAKLWSNWGDSIFTQDGNFYCSIGDHQGPHGHSYVYKVNPQNRTMEMVADYSKVVAEPAENYTPGKIHGPLMDGGDGWLYFIGYQGGGGTDDEHGYKGDWMLRYSPATGAVENLGIPVPNCGSPCSVFHVPSRTIYGLTSPGRNAPVRQSQLFVYDLDRKELVFFGGPAPNMARALLLAGDGRVYYSHSPPPPKPEGQEAKKKPRPDKSKETPAEGVLVRYDPKTRQVALTDVKVPGDGIMRAASRPNSDGVAYCISKDGVVFSFDTNTEKVTEIVPAFVKGPLYTATCILDQTERFLYIVPSSHGGSKNHGTAVIQLDLKTGRRRVLAFLNDYFRKQQDYNLGGTFGTALSKDGSMLFVCWNGGPAAQQKNDFGLCSAMIIHIPQQER